MSFHIGQFLQLIQGQIDLGTARVGLFRATVSEVDGPGRNVRLIRDGSTVAEDEWRQVIVGTMPVVGQRVNCLPYYAPGGQTPLIAVIGTSDLASGINVRDVGATGDGTTNDAAAIQSAIDQATTGGMSGIVTVPNGTYRLLSALTLRSNLRLNMAPGATLDFSGAPTNTVCLIAVGTESTTTLLTANATKSATSITVTSAAGIIAGSLIRVASDTIFDTQSTNSKIGELVRVQAVSGTTITLATPLEDTYTTAAAGAVSVVTPLRRLMIEGGRILGGGEGSGHTGLQVTLGDDIRITETVFDRTVVTGIVFRDTIHAHVTDCLFETFWHNTSAYGVSVTNACQDSLVADCHFRDVRHAFSTNNSSFSRGIPRRITFARNTVNDSAGPDAGGTGTGDAVDTHTAAEQIFFLDNIIHGASGSGINFEAASGAIRGNQISYPGQVSGDGIHVHSEGDRSGDITISDNTIRNAKGTAINVLQGIRGTVATYRGVTISDNDIYDPGVYGINVSTPVALKNQRVTVRDNRIENPPNIFGAIRLEDVTGGIVSGNVINNAGGVGIRIQDATDIVVTDNYVTFVSGSGSAGIYLNATTTGAVAGCLINNNRVTGPSPTNSTGLQITNNAVDCTVGNANDFRGSTTEQIIGTGTGHRVR